MGSGSIADRARTTDTGAVVASEVELEVDGRTVTVTDDGMSLLDVLRDQLGVVSVKDGCSPQGQCGCCTVLVDGRARVSCVTPVRRVAGRNVTTLDGLDPEVRRVWTQAFCATGASQCGFCTPGIIVRLSTLETHDEPGSVERALAAHVCRCTGWQTIVEAARLATSRANPAERSVERDLVAASRRATIEGGADQRVGEAVACGLGGFADDLAPRESLVAVADSSGAWHVAESTHAARRAAGRVQGRNTTRSTEPPIAVPDGSWDVVLATSWVEPAYLETDSVWCSPGGEPVGPLTNGGAFGAKVASGLPSVSRRLADEHGRAVRVRWTREDTVRWGPKRPPMAAGLRRDGTGHVRVARALGVADHIRAVLPGAVVEEVELDGPPTSGSIRGAGWIEASVLAAVLPVAGSGLAAARDLARSGVTVTHPDGGSATVAWDGGTVAVEVDAGDPLDDVVVRSYVIGAVHMGLGWVCSEGVAVHAGEVLDLTMRSFGVLRASDMPPVSVEIARSTRPAVAVSEAVMAASSAVAWLAAGLAPQWPLGVAPGALWSSDLGTVSA